MSEWWETTKRNLMERPFAMPLLSAYPAFVNIKRYEHMPYYFYPAGVSVVSFEDRFINLLDWLCDAHEETRNPQDKNKNFYQRAVFVYKNFNRYSNPTICNVMFDTQATRHAYDRLNAIVQRQTQLYYAAATVINSACLMYMSYFFRYRRVGPLPILAVGSAFFLVFDNTNESLYKLMVDRPILAEARRLGLEEHC